MYSKLTRKFTIYYFKKQYKFFIFYVLWMFRLDKKIMFESATLFTTGYYMLFSIAISNKIEYFVMLFSEALFIHQTSTLVLGDGRYIIHIMKNYWNIQNPYYLR